MSDLQFKSNSIRQCHISWVEIYSYWIQPVSVSMVETKSMNSASVSLIGRIVKSLDSTSV